MGNKIAIKTDKLSKVYKLYNSPKDRLKESIHPFRKQYHSDFYALHNLSIEIPKGTTVGIIGKNGSGKSTLLKILTGVLTPTSGTVQMNGKVTALLELGAGFNPEFTGMENIYLNGTIMGYSKKEIDKKLDEILSFADIGEFINQPAKVYSSGMFARLAFAVAVSVEPDILIVDEALAVGDMRFQLKCIDKMKSFKKENKTVLFVSHDTYSVRNFCDEVIWMMDGHIHMRGNVNTVTDCYQDFMKFALKNKTTPSVPTETKNEILSIDKVTFVDDKGKTKQTFNFGEKISIEIEYTLFADMKGIVGGVAIFDKENTYVSGLNTKLDKIELPDKPGTYKLTIAYDDLLLMAGTYFVDVGFFESSALVRLDYKSKANNFLISTDAYIAEGLTYLKHSWNVRERE